MIKHEDSAHRQKALDSSDDLALHDERDLEKVRGSFTLFLLSYLIGDCAARSIDLSWDKYFPPATLQQSYFRAVIPLQEKLARIEAVEAELAALWVYTIFYCVVYKVAI